MLPLTVEDLVYKFRMETFSKGMNITKANRWSVSFIQEGEVQILMKDNDYELHLTTLRPGDYFGFWSLVTENPDIRYTA